MRKGVRIAVWIGAAVVAVLVAGAGALAYTYRPISQAEADAAIQERLRKSVAENESVSAALFTTYSGKDERLRQYVAGTLAADSSEPARVDSQFHSASVGKTMLATVFGQLVDEGRVQFGDPVSKFVQASVLEGLFVVDGVDHSGEVTTGQLLSHTSGAADYFEGPVLTGPSMIDIITQDPDRLFSPQDLLAFSREHQAPVAAPGEKFAYSDTGYVLAGLALEAIEQTLYEQILQERIFSPLGMRDSFVLTEYGTENGTLAVTARGVDLSDRNALSVDWAGGGVVTTTADLVTFLRALTSEGLCSGETLARLTSFEHQYDTGITTGWA